MFIKPLIDPIMIGLPKNIKDVVEMACEQPTLIDALTVVAVWDAERFVRQAKRHFETGETFSDGRGWETCFKTCFEQVFSEWHKKQAEKVRREGECPQHPVPGREHSWTMSRAPSQFGKWFCIFCGKPKPEGE